MNYDDDFYDDQLVRKESKVGRNDPCPCGSGKKYKQCCLTKNPANNQYISAYEQNFLQKRDDVQSFSLKEIREMSLIELQSLDMKHMAMEQLSTAINTMIHGDFSLSFAFLTELRKYYVETNGVLPGKKRVVKLLKRKITIPKEDDLYDHWIMEFVYSIEMENRLEFTPQLLEMFFDTTSDDYQKTEFLYHLHKKKLPDVLKYIEKTCIKGITTDEEMVDLYFSIKDHYPGIAVMLFRSLIASFPNRYFDIETMNEYIHEIYAKFDIESEEDPAMHTFYRIYELENQEEENEIEVEELQFIRKELRQAQAESANLHRQIKHLLQKQQKTQPTETVVIKSDENQIQKSKEKIGHLKEIIKSKQQAIRVLRESIQVSSNIEPEKSEDSYIHEIAIDNNNFTVPKVIFPIFPEKFKKSVELLDAAIGKQAIKAFTGFITNDPKVMKQTKKLTIGDHYYSIRLGIHYRLIINYTPASQPIPEYVIHRKDLETTVKKLK
jgi:uncharacterized protein YecA (UPF0149 family)